MRRRCAYSAVFAAALVLSSRGLSLAEDAAPAKPAPPPREAPPDPPRVFSPFGPPYDPTRPPPEEPKEEGPGITQAKLIVAGMADVEELRAGPATNEPLSAVALDITLAPGSTTPALTAASVTAKTEKGSVIPVYATCTPTAIETSRIYHGEGYSLMQWHVAVGDHTWFCNGFAGMAVRIGPGGVRLMNKFDKPWNGPLLLFFRVAADLLREVRLPGTTVSIPASTHTAAAHR